MRKEEQMNERGRRKMRTREELLRKQDELRAKDKEDPIITAQRDAIGFLLGELEPITDEKVAPPQTDEDIDNLIKVLRKEKAEIAEYSFFGDPNWQIADAQIELCEWAKGL